MQSSSGRAFLTRMGLRNIQTNRTMSLASVLVLVSCLMLIGLVFLAATNLNSMFAEFSSRNVIMVYLRQGLEDQQVESIENRIKTMGNVKRCTYITSQAAYDRATAKNEGDLALLEGVDVAFMPAGFEVSPERLEDFDATVEQLKALDSGIQSVRSFQGVAAQLSAVQNALTVLGVAVITVLLLVSVFIISSTVQATMFSRQQEIKVMKSVGAAPAFIRWPFLVEGIVLGVMGALAALGVVCVVYVGMSRALEPFFNRLLSGFRLLPVVKQLPTLLPSFVAVGAIAGGGGSMLSITRYLKENIYEEAELEDE
ncbi:MAG: permease-like cell division protein FtsX [Oscillospiraceae bacterium]|jgi:cell division transport system permease protein|nr:permease-like cell division protein FtsX [Oscillospiraceae bacterium]